MYEKKFLSALVLTVVGEFLVLVFLRNFFVRKLRKFKLKEIFLFSFFASSLTLPYLWFVLPIFIVNRMLYLLISEFLATVIEAVFYWQIFKTSFLQAISLSFTANFFSFLTGFIFFN